ncbi:uncharacterized protein MELLADRAFT_76017 [Melampsora larici-populina 98AG31]|uniref:Vacuolar protein sorting-associated protein 51 homolog n=1 Tax=Melampsora larici-populina (strain 98AG31 / pathotype 3-4-7) TaxID=747676 RepID=F4S975_MELLP|nr:uncharacterized protein MELLADRAFT_76017 [Melampsora larici-populina 98AG31]EGF98813.1 hypothetical protein MELLADRAFT_76017 [Melampsora larici-populina 98AG31]
MQSKQTELNTTSRPNPKPMNQFNKISTTGDPTLAKKRNRNLLRDYYGLSSTSSNHPPEETHDMDSVLFNHQVWFERLIQDSSGSTTSTGSSGSRLDLILSNANQIVSEIRELDGERQSLVYNHHHELVDASVTIGKMKTSAETLDNTLNELQTEFSSISETISTISNSFSSSSSTKPKSQTPKTPSTKEKELTEYLLPIISLPIILRSLINTGNKIKSDQLWGEWEIILKSFEELGIENIKKIGNECREILRQARNLK